MTADDDWRAALRHRCLGAREVMVRHRWAPGLLGSRTSIPPGLYPYYEEILATMIRGGLSYHLAHRGIHALGTMVLGFTQELFTPADDGGTMDEEAAEAEFAAMAAVLPHLTAMVASRGPRPRGGPARLVRQPERVRVHPRPAPRRPGQGRGRLTAAQRRMMSVP